VALQQLNLKLPAPVLALWRAQAAAEGLSVRDWLISVTGAPTAPQVAAAGDPELAERVAAIEAAIADLGGQVAALAALPSPHAKAAPPEVREAQLAELGGDGIPTAELAIRLGVKRASLNTRITRQGGVRHGLIIDGWQCVGLAPTPRGGPPRACWRPIEPVSTRELPGQPQA
jgi:hypothetical protein